MGKKKKKHSECIARKIPSALLVPFQFNNRRMLEVVDVQDHNQNVQLDIYFTKKNISA